MQRYPKKMTKHDVFLSQPSVARSLSSSDCSSYRTRKIFSLWISSGGETTRTGFAQSAVHSNNIYWKRLPPSATCIKLLSCTHPSLQNKTAYQASIHTWSYMCVCVCRINMQVKLLFYSSPTPLFKNSITCPWIGTYWIHGQRLVPTKAQWYGRRSWSTLPPWAPNIDKPPAAGASAWRWDWDNEPEDKAVTME